MQTITIEDLKLKPEADGCGFFYGHLDKSEKRFCIDLLPSKNAAQRLGIQVTTSVAQHQSLWIVYIDGRRKGVAIDFESAQQKAVDVVAQE